MSNNISNNILANSSPAKRQSDRMRHFSTLAGPITQVTSRKKYTVQFKDMIDYDKLVYRVWTRIVAYGALLLVILFASMLFNPSHWIVNLQPQSKTHSENWLMLGCLFILQVFLIIGTFSATRATIKAKNPKPVNPPKGLRVAFITTRAPGEPIDLVERTLEAIKNVSYKGGRVDVWLLDETGSTELIDICRKLSVNYFSRNSIGRLNTGKPAAGTKKVVSKLLRIISFGILAHHQDIALDPYFAAKSKHGNINSWRDFLKFHNVNYDILAGVDTDQVPEPNYLERLLGYFRDENVAYVVGPQVYGNSIKGLSGLVARWSESQASFFQSTIQRAGNASASPMFVGTNYAVRMGALDQIGGFQPCITEDMATGLAIHTKRNPSTGKRWKSVYTPDVLAVGEGPEYWSTYFTQQWRWAAGTFDTWKRVVWKNFYKLSPFAMLNYFLMLTYYPINALTWLLGIISSMTYLLTGATAIMAPWSMFVSLYLMSLVMQLSLYFWNRRYNVSPFEREGTYGVPGILLSTLTSPVYLSALWGMLINKKAHFVVTQKGGSTNPDWFATFKTHLQWAAILTAGLIYGFTHNHAHPAMLVWSGAQLLICLVPFILGMSVAARGRINASRAMKGVMGESLLPVGEPSNA